MTPPLPTDWPRIVLLYLAGLGAAAQYGKVSVVFDRLAGVWPDAGAGAGFALSLVGVVGIVLGVTAGIMVARLSYRRAVIWGLWAGAALSALQATLPALPVFLATRVLEGLSHLALVVAIPTLIAQLSAPRDRPFTLTLWGTFFGVAFTVLVWGGLPLADRTGLAGLFLAHAGWMAAFALILTAALPRAEPPPPGDPLSLSAVLRRHATIYRSPQLSAPAIAWLPYTFAYVSLLTLLPPFIAPDWRAPVVGGMPLIGIAASLTLGVWLLGRMSAVTVMSLGFAGSAATAVALVALPGDPVLCLVLAATLGLVQGAGFAAVPELNSGPAERAQANGALAQTGNIGNTLGPPVLLAILGAGGHTAMLLAAAGVLAAGLLAQQALARARRAHS